MQIVIDIPEKEYEWLKTCLDNPLINPNITYTQKLIAQGTPLPKGHGDLIDLNALKSELWWVTDCPHIKLTEQAIDIWEAINTAKTVIPTDEVD